MSGPAPLLSAPVAAGFRAPPWIAEAEAIVRAIEDAHDGRALREVRAAELAIVEAHYSDARDASKDEQAAVEEPGTRVTCDRAALALEAARGLLSIAKSAESAARAAAVRS